MNLSELSDAAGIGGFFVSLIALGFAIAARQNSSTAIQIAQSIGSIRVFEGGQGGAGGADGAGGGGGGAAFGGIGGAGGSVIHSHNTD